MTDLEKLEKLNHIRACMLRACEYIQGKSKMSRTDTIGTLEDGMEAVTEMILEAKHGVTKS